METNTIEPMYRRDKAIQIKHDMIEAMGTEAYLRFKEYLNQIDEDERDVLQDVVYSMAINSPNHAALLRDLFSADVRESLAVEGDDPDDGIPY